jgi:hypothetical protein
MADNQSKLLPNPNSEEGGGPAHNTTLDDPDGRLPGADLTSNRGQAIQASIEQRPAPGPRNAEIPQGVSEEEWVSGVLNRTLEVRLRMNVPQPTLTTLDKMVAESLVRLGFGDAEAAMCLLLLPHGEGILGELNKLVKAIGAGQTPNVRHMVGVWLQASTLQYAATVGQGLLHDAAQGGSLSALGDNFTPPRAAAMGLPHPEPVDLLGSSQQPSGLFGAAPGSGVGSLFGPPALAGSFSSINNTPSNPPAPGAEGAVSRAGFCGAAPMGAPFGASSAVRSTSPPWAPSSAPSCLL